MPCPIHERAAEASADDLVRAPSVLELAIVSLGERQDNPSLARILEDRHEGVDKVWDIRTQAGISLVKILIKQDDLYYYLPFCGLTGKIEAGQFTRLDSHALFGPGSESDILIRIELVELFEPGSNTVCKVTQLPAKTDGPYIPKEYYQMNVRECDLSGFPEHRILPAELSIDWKVKMPEWAESIADIEEVGHPHEWVITRISPGTVQYVIPIQYKDGKKNCVFISQRSGSDVLDVTGFGHYKQIRKQDLPTYFRREVSFNYVLRVFV